MRNTLPSSDDCRQFLHVAAEAAAEAGKILRHYWGNLSKIRAKTTSWDLVTEADAEAERAVLEILSAAFPTHSIVAEESGLSAVEHSEFLWAVDPLDGTTNYTHQYPMVATSIGLIYRGTPIVGVVFNPILNELFLGAHSLGATLNGQKLQVSLVNRLEQSLLASGFAYDRRTSSSTNYSEFCRMTHMTQGVRRGGAAAIDLAYVAAGRLDGYWERGLNIWDIAAGVVLITEAGGKVSDYNEKPVDLQSGRILATNGHIHALLSQELVALERETPKI
jgi:myo-inositol-1(or 4)-monophosphatase